MTGKHIKKRRQEMLKKRRQAIREVKERLGMHQQSFDRIDNPQRPTNLSTLYWIRDIPPYPNHRKEVMTRLIGEKDAKPNT
jgi:hypothetical protein